MAYETLGNLATIVQRKLSLVVGSSIQTYAEDRITDAIQEAYQFIFKHRYWPDSIQWETVTLDGTTGRPTVDFVSIQQPDDILNIFPSDSDAPLRRTPASINPNRLTGTQAAFFDHVNDAKLLRVWPLTATDTLNVAGRVAITTFQTSTTIPADSTFIALWAAWYLMESDGDNPGGAAMLQGLMESRLATLVERIDNAPIQLSPYSRADVPTRWEYSA